MNIISLANEKGGVGKSTVAVHLAMGLALRGLRVMLVDADAQGNATERCGVRMRAGLYDLIVREAEWSDVAVKVAPERYGIPGDVVPRNGSLYVVPSNVETRNIASSVSDLKLFNNRLEELDGLIDVVVIDTSPTPSLLHGAIYIATDWIIYPTTCTLDSFRGLGFSIQHREGADGFRKQNLNLPAIKIMGIVPTSYRPTTVEQDTNLDALKKQFGRMVWQPMPLRTRWTEAESERCAVWTLDANHAAAGDAFELIDRVQGVLNAKTQAG